jgi:hypothetical protein
MAETDYHLYEDTKQNLISAANGDPELEGLVEDQLADMKETGYFDVQEYPDDDDDYYDPDFDRMCGYPCGHCGEFDED